MVKKLLFWLLLAAILCAAGYWWWQRNQGRQLPPAATAALPFLQQLPNVSAQLQNTLSSVITNLTTNSDQAPTVPLHQRAFEIARYNYCQAVVADYQERYPVSKPINTAIPSN